MAHYHAIKHPPSGDMPAGLNPRGDEYLDGGLNPRSRYVRALYAAHIGRDGMLEGIAPADLEDAALTATVARLEAEAATEAENIAIELEHDREQARAQHQANLAAATALQECATKLKPWAGQEAVADAIEVLHDARADLSQPPAVPTSRRGDPALNMALGACRAEEKRRAAQRAEELNRLRTQLGALGVSV